MSDQQAANPVAAVQIQGARDYQEDSLDEKYLDGSSNHNEERLLVLADGMGGHVGGERASTTTLSEFINSYVSGDADVRTALRNALDHANECMETIKDEEPEYSDMGTTLIAAAVKGSDLYWVSVGDSPMWLFRNGQLQRLNADHSMAPIIEGLVEIGRLSEEEAAVDPRRHQLRSAVMGEELSLVDLCPEPAELVSGDMVVLASDGVETLTDEELVSILNNNGNQSVVELAQAIMNGIEECAVENQDNASLIIYQH